MKRNEEEEQGGVNIVFLYILKMTRGEREEEGMSSGKDGVKKKMI